MNRRAWRDGPTWWMLLAGGLIGGLATVAVLLRERDEQLAAQLAAQLGEAP